MATIAHEGRVYITSDDRAHFYQQELAGLAQAFGSGDLRALVLIPWWHDAACLPAWHVGTEEQRVSVIRNLRTMIDTLERPEGERDEVRYLADVGSHFASRGLLSKEEAAVAYVECVLQQVYEHGSSADPVNFHALAVKLLNEPEKGKPRDGTMAASLEHVHPKLKFVGKNSSRRAKRVAGRPARRPAGGSPS